MSKMPLLFFQVGNPDKLLPQKHWFHSECEARLNARVRASNELNPRAVEVTPIFYYPEGQRASLQKQGTCVVEPRQGSLGRRVYPTCRRMYPEPANCTDREEVYEARQFTGARGKSRRK